MTASRVKSAERVMDILDLLSRRGLPLPAMEIARALELPKSTTHHLLNVMRERHYVTYRPEERAWTLGVAAFEVGASYLRSGPLAHDGQRFMTALTNATGETAHLAVLQGTDVIYLDKREPVSPGVRLVTEVGTRLPAHLTAVGRALLSRLDTDRLAALYAGYAWPTRTGRGPTSLGGLRQMLAEDRAGGVAVERDTTTSGIECVAAPVVGRDGGAVAALGVAYLAAAKDAAATAPHVRRAAADFSRCLGANTPGVPGVA